MPIDARHEQYDHRAGQWQRVRDTLEGIDAVKKQTSEYLPVLSGQDDADYRGYLRRAEFYDAVSRTLLGLVGMIFRKDPTITLPEGLAYLNDNVDLKGTPLPVFAKAVVEEVCAVGRLGILVDTGNSDDTTQNRPYFQSYTAEQVTNWRVQIIAGKPVLVQLVLHEKVEIAGEDGIGSGYIEQYRQIDRLAEGVFVTLWQKNDKGDWAVVERIEPMVQQARGVRLEAIPFVCIGATGLDIKPEKPPLLGLADTALSHYRTSADLEQGRHFTSLPTPWVSGLSTQAGQQPLRMGGGTAWILPKDAVAGMLEYTGQGLQSLEKAMEEKEAKMAALGSRILEDQKAGVEAADAIGRRQMGEHSLLASIADTCSRGIEQAIAHAAAWQRIELGTDSVSFALNTDFYPAPLDPSMIDAQMKLLQGGMMPWSTFVENMQRGEILDPSKTAEQILAEIRDGDFGLRMEFDEDQNSEQQSQGEIESDRLAE
jgi:hypothetical protein